MWVLAPVTQSCRRQPLLLGRKVGLCLRQCWRGPMNVKITLTVGPHGRRLSRDDRYERFETGEVRHGHSENRPSGPRRGRDDGECLVHSSTSPMCLHRLVIPMDPFALFMVKIDRPMCTWAGYPWPCQKGNSCPGIPVGDHVVSGADPGPSPLGMPSIIAACFPRAAG